MSTDKLRELASSANDAMRKFGLEGLEAEVVLILDVSRSMFPIYRARIVQDLVPQLLGLALNFDDDGIIPAYAFGDHCRHLRDLRKTDFLGWVDRDVIRTGTDYQSSCMYAPVINEVCRYYFPEDWDRPALKETVGRIFKQERVVYPMLSAPRTCPVFAIFVTGGDCEDQNETADVIRRSSRLPIFWQFIGLSAQGRLSPFRFLKSLDKLGNTYVDNAGFFEPGDVRNPASLYRGLLNELPEYLPRPEVKAMLRPKELGGLDTRGHRPTIDAQNPNDVQFELSERLSATISAHEPEPEAEPEPEPEPERDLSVLREKFSEVEWVEGTQGGRGAVRAAAPLQRKTEDVPTTGERRRARPSEAQQEEVVRKEDSRVRVSERLARLKSSLATQQAPPDAPSDPSRNARVDVEALKARITAQVSEDDATVAATGHVVDQEGLPLRPQPPVRPQPPARPQPPPRRK